MWEKPFSSAPPQERHNMGRAAAFRYLKSRKSSGGIFTWTGSIGLALFWEIQLWGCVCLFLAWTLCPNSLRGAPRLQMLTFVKIILGLGKGRACDWKVLFTCETKTVLPGNSHHPWWQQHCPEPSGSSARPPCPFLEANGEIKAKCVRAKESRSMGLDLWEEVLIGSCSWAHWRERDTKYTSKWPKDNHSQTLQKGTTTKKPPD